MASKEWKRLPRKLKKKLGDKAKEYLLKHNTSFNESITKRAQRRMENLIGYYNYWDIQPPNIRGTGR